MGRAGTGSGGGGGGGLWKEGGERGVSYVERGSDSFHSNVNTARDYNNWFSDLSPGDAWNFADTYQLARYSIKFWPERQCLDPIIIVWEAFSL